MTTATLRTTPSERQERAFKFANPIRAFRERQANLDEEIKQAREDLADLAESRAMLVAALGKLEANEMEANGLERGQ